MNTQGNIGYVPEYFDLLRAANYLHMTPMELLKQPVGLMQAAINAISMEAELRPQL